MSRQFRRSIALFGAAALLVVGCSADGDDDADTTTTEAADTSGEAPGDSIELGTTYEETLAAGDEMTYSFEPDPGMILTLSIENDADSQAGVDGTIEQDTDLLVSSDSAEPDGEVTAGYTLAEEDGDSDFVLTLRARGDADVSFVLDGADQNDGGEDGDAPGELSSPRPLDLGASGGSDDQDEADSSDDADDADDEESSDDEDSEESEGDDEGSDEDADGLPGHLGGNDLADYFSFEAEGGEQIEIPVANDADSEGRVFAELITNGETLESITVPAGGEDAITRTLGEDEAGEYILLVEGEAESDYTFDPDLGLQQDCGQEGDASGEAGSPREIEVDDSCEGSLGDTDAADYYSFEAEGGTVLSIEVANDADSEGRVFASLLTGGEQLENVTVAAGGTETIGRTLGEGDGGTYVILIEGDSVPSISYTFDLGGAGQDDGGSGGDAPADGDGVSVEADDEVSGSLGDDDESDAYSISLSGSGGSIEVSNDADSEGRVFLTASTGGDQIDRVTVAAGGTETLDLEDASGDISIVVTGDSVPTISYSFTVSA